MKKRLIITLMLLVPLVAAHSQKVETKKCKTCGKSLKECTYKGRHTTSSPQATQKQGGASSNVRMDGKDIIFSLGGIEYRYKMVFVQGGTYLMGAQNNNSSAPNYDADAPQLAMSVHSVTVGDFYMGETEVTQALWESVMSTDVSWNKGNDLPVDHPTYNGAVRFINKLNKITGLQFRLPTEEEWEYAARGGQKSKGYKCSGSNNPNDVARWGGSGHKNRTIPVKSLMPNELELYDMSGNVYEWCSNCWREDYYSSSDCTKRVIRGGNWITGGRNELYNTMRTCSEPKEDRAWIGFRLAITY